MNLSKPKNSVKNFFPIAVFKKSLRVFVLFLLFYVFFATPINAFAEEMVDVFPLAKDIGVISQETEVNNLFINGLILFLRLGFMFLAIASFSALIAGIFKLALASDNFEAIKKAQSMLWSSVLMLVFAVSVYIYLPNLVDLVWRGFALYRESILKA